MVSPIEKARRELKETNPDLYHYVVAVECGRVLDGVGQWRLAANYRRRAEVLRKK